MDKVRFGRALGYGARHAARAVAQAVEAATTPDPARPSSPATETAQAPPVTRVVAQTQQAARTAGRSFFAPLASFSRTLWLEVTGSFFALIAMAMGGAAWKLRGAVHLPTASPEAHRLYVCTAIFAIFAYFAASSFVRARRA